MIRAFFLVGVAAMCCLALAETGWAAEDAKVAPVVVRCWHGIGELIGKAFEAQAEAFNATQEDVRVELLLRNGYGGTLADFQKAREAGDPPEIAVIEVHSVPVVASSGNLASIDELIRGDEDFTADDIIPATLLNL